MGPALAALPMRPPLSLCAIQPCPLPARRESLAVFLSLAASRASLSLASGDGWYDRGTIVAQPDQFWSCITAHAGNVSKTNGAVPPQTAPRTSWIPSRGGTPPHRFWGLIVRTVAQTWYPQSYG